MTHLKITQGNTIADTEELGKEIILKLYELAVSGDLDENSELLGRIHVTQGYRIPINYLNNLFQGKLFITADDYIIPFEDQNMVTYLNSIGVGSNGIITEAQAAAATTVANSLNTTVTKFNELKYFTQITESNGGWDGAGSGTCRFILWTNLQEIDISNFTSIGHKDVASINDSFYGCINLKKVIASNKLTKIGRSVFSGDINLEEITGLSGTILIEAGAFNDCSKLKGDCFNNCEILFHNPAGCNVLFRNCSAITSITLNSNNTGISNMCFRNCTALTNINLNNITTFGSECFANCRNLIIPAVDLINTESVGASSFDYCTVSGELNLPKLTGTLPNSVFRANRQITKIKCLGKVTSLGSMCFSKHTDPETPALTEVYLPYECTSLGQGCFIDNTNLTTIKQYTQSIDDWTNGEPSATTNINRITVFGNSCLRGCKSLNLTPLDLIGATSIDSDAFLLTPITGDLVLPNILALGWWPFGSTDNGFTSVDFTGSTFTTIERGLFEKHSSLDHVIFPDTLSTIRGYYHFYQTNPRYIKMPSNTMVTFESGRTVNDMQLSSSTKIYVPDSIVNDYRNNAGWSAKASQIFPMSQFATDFPNG